MKDFLVHKAMRVLCDEAGRYARIAANAGFNPFLDASASRNGRE